MASGLLRWLVLAGNILLLAAIGLCSWIFFFVVPPQGLSIVAVTQGQFKPRIAIREDGILDAARFEVVWRALDKVIQPPVREVTQSPTGSTDGSPRVTGPTPSLQNKVKASWVIYDPEDPARSSAFFSIVQNGGDTVHLGVGDRPLGEGDLDLRLKKIEPKDQEGGEVRSYRIVFEDEKGRTTEIEYRLE